MRDWTIIVVVTVMIVFVAVLPPHPARGANPAPDDPNPDPGLTEITFQRTACRGPCPAYKVTLRPDGTVTYVGEANVERLGRHDGRVGRSAFRRLAMLMTSAKFFDLNDTYGRRLNDAPATITAATRGGQTRTVTNYTGDDEPIELWGLEMAIDGVLTQAAWEEKR